jgi:peptide/nickel transport system permease protein
MAIDPASRAGDPETDLDVSIETPAEGAAGFLIGETPEKDPWAEGQHAPAIGPWRLAGRRLRRNKVALVFGALFIVLVVVCLLAPFYSKHIAKIGPNTNNVTGTINVRGHSENVVSFDGVPIGPTFTRHYFFGADTNGRDLAVRLLYGGRTSLLIGGASTIIIVFFGTLLGLLSGYLRGPVDAVLRWFMELIWSFPPVILGVVVGTALDFGGLGPLKGNSLLIPILIIGGIYIPYLGKPIRGEVLRLREMDFVDAARVVGVSPWRIMISEILPNAASTITVFVPIMLANTILLEAYLSFLGAGVQAPNASWGTLISDGLNYVSTTPTFSLVPGAMLVLTVLSINVVGDGVRDALDPRAQVRIKT